MILLKIAKLERALERELDPIKREVIKAEIRELINLIEKIA